MNLKPNEQKLTGRERTRAVDVSLDHLVRTWQQLLRSRDAERRGSFEVDPQLELRELSDRQIGSFTPRKNAVDVFGADAESFRPC
jgi:hypothetical protein